MVSMPPSGRAQAPAPGAPTPPAPDAPGLDAVGAADLDRGEREAERVETGRDPADPVRARSLAEAAAALGDRPVPLPNGGPGVGATLIAERTEGIAMRAVGTVGEELRRAAEAAPRVPGVTRRVLPRRDFAVDPDSVKGHRYATAAAQLRRDGLTYQPGQEVRVDYRAYVELVPVAGILADPWDKLPEAPEPEAPEAAPIKVQRGSSAR